MASASANSIGYTAPSGYAAAASSRSSVRVAPEPVAILRSVYNAPTETDSSFDFAFETENGISQEAVGEMRTIGDEEVVVMRGSYQYTDANGDLVEVSWTADENGYNAESNILPVAPAIPFPEQAEAVARQIEFAQQQREAAASTNSYTVQEAPAQPTYTYSRYL